MRTAASSLLMGLLLIGAGFLSTSCTTDVTDTISSTTPGLWWGENGTIKEEYKAIAFTTLNFDNVKRDLVRGEGEYLASLAMVIGVTAADQSRFFVVAQEQASDLVRSGHTTPEQVLAALQAAWPSASRLR
jgi:hypothetical protein